MNKIRNQDNYERPRVWRYQRGNQNPHIEREKTTQWPKEIEQKDKQRSTKNTYKSKDRVTRTPPKTGSDLDVLKVKINLSLHILLHYWSWWLYFQQHYIYICIVSTLIVDKLDYIRLYREHLSMGNDSRIGSLNLLSPSFFLLNWLFHVKKMSGHVYIN